ncbi:hypothetical protein [Xanthobacter autotrophicus]|uniref:hypothetical protein n=1 Tax=Xanthobacter autotrophicus TaxID=280 RepID=UPI00372960CD
MSIARGLRGLAADIAIDVVALGGAGSVAYGAWLIYAPAGFISGGFLLIIAAVAAARREKP